jgi:hypothetical protein
MRLPNPRRPTGAGRPRPNCCWRDGGSAGLYRGVGPIVETDRYPSAAHLGRTGLPSIPQGRRLGPTEFPCLMTGPDGEKGMVHLEHHVFGRCKPYGF